MTNFFHATKDKVKNQRPGYRNRAWLALASWFSVIAEPIPGSTGAAAKTITNDHIFLDDFGFIEIYCLQKSVEGDGESTSDTGAMHDTWKPKFFIPGDSPELETMIEDGLLNEPLVMIVQDANCPDGGLRQFGCDCTPMYVTSAKFTSGSDVKKGWEIGAETNCRYFYEGSFGSQIFSLMTGDDEQLTTGDDEPLIFQ